MSSLTAEDIQNIQQAALPELGKHHYVPLLMPQTRYIAFEHLHKKRTKDEVGKSLQWNLATELSDGHVQNIGLYEALTLDEEDNLHNANIPWTRKHYGVSYDVQEDFMSKGPAQIINLIRSKHDAKKAKYVQKIEDEFWSRPPTSADARKTPYGVKMYLVRVSGSSGEFTSAVPTNHSTIAGIDPSDSTFSEWRNWADNYTNVSGTDLVRKLRKAVRQTSFIDPFKLPNYGGSTAGGDHERLPENFGIYTNENVIEKLEEYLESRNDNLGDQLAAYQGKVKMLSTRVEYVPQLDGDTDDPLYGINWDTMGTCFLKGMKHFKSGPTTPSNQPTVVRFDYISSYNLKCYDRRRNFILTTGNSDI